MAKRKPKTKKQTQELLQRAARQFAEILIEELVRRKEEEYKNKLAKNNK